MIPSSIVLAILVTCDAINPAETDIGQSVDSPTAQPPELSIDIGNGPVNGSYNQPILRDNQVRDAMEAIGFERGSTSGHAFDLNELPETSSSSFDFCNENPSLSESILASGDQPLTGSIPGSVFALNSSALQECCLENDKDHDASNKALKRKRGRPRGRGRYSDLDDLLNHEVADITDYKSLCHFLRKEWNAEEQEALSQQSSCYRRDYLSCAKNVLVINLHGTNVALNEIIEIPQSTGALQKLILIANLYRKLTLIWAVRV